MAQHGHACGDRGKGDRLASLGELGAGTLRPGPAAAGSSGLRLGDEGVEAGEQPAVPVCFGDPAAFSASAASAWASIRWAARMGRSAALARKQGQCSQMLAYGQAAWAARPSSAHSAFRDSRLPWWVNRNWVGRPVRGCGIGRPAERVAA